MLPFPPREDDPSRPAPSERAAARDRQWHTSDDADRADDWRPFRTALGLMFVGGLLALGSGVFMFLYFQIPPDPLVSRASAVGPTLALVVAAAGLVGLVLMAVGLVLSHGLPEATGFRSTSKACMVGLAGTLAVAIVLLYALVANELTAAGNRWDRDELSTTQRQPWSRESLLLLWVATYLLLNLTMALWLVLLAQVARHLRCSSLSGLIYLFTVLSVVTAVLNLALTALRDNENYHSWRGPTRYAVGFMVEYEDGMPQSNVVVVPATRDRSPLLVWGRALVATSMMLFHQLLVLLVRRATFAASGPTFAMQQAEIPSDWRWDRNQPGD